jgi:hypothetical protein
MVRSAAIKEARRWQALRAADTNRQRAALSVGRDAEARRVYWIIRDEQVRALLEQRLRHAVERARKANRDWRRYRARHVDELADR